MSEFGADMNITHPGYTEAHTLSHDTLRAWVAEEITRDLAVRQMGL